MIARIEDATGRQADLHFADWRPGDQRYFVADTRRAVALLGLPPALPWRDGLHRLAQWAMAEREAMAAPAPQPELAGAGGGA